MRLLFCKTCSTLEEVPDLGRDLAEGEADPFVEGLVMTHTQRDSMGHGSAAMANSPFRLMDVDDEKWRTERQSVIDTVNKENKKVGFDAWVYESQSTYSEDALKCYRAHHRPKGACIDWRADSKRIGRPTAEGQQAVKDEYKLGQKDPHLCDYCPVASWVQTQKNFAAGLYKE